MALITLKDKISKKTYTGKVTFQKKTREFQIYAANKQHFVTVATYRTRAFHSRKHYSYDIVLILSRRKVRFSYLYPSKAGKGRGILTTGQNFDTGKWVPFSCILKIKQ